MALGTAEAALALAAVTVLGRRRVGNFHHLHLVMEQLTWKETSGYDVSIYTTVLYGIYHLFTVFSIYTTVK